MKSKSRAETKNCDECEYFGVHLPCTIGHKPRFYMPKGYLDTDWGYRMKCNDFRKRKPMSDTNTNVDFGTAIRALKEGRRVTRSGWNGRGMYLWLLPAATVKAEWCREPHLKEVAEANGGEVECLGSIRMYTVNSEGRRAVLTGWLASQSDMLSEDWVVLE